MTLTPEQLLADMTLTPEQLLAYDALIAARKGWADYRFPNNTPDNAPLRDDIGSQKYNRYEKWLDRGYRPTKPTRYMFPIPSKHGYDRYDLGWKFGDFNGPQRGELHKAMEMTRLYSIRKRWKRANTSTGHLFAWSIGGKAKRTWTS